MLMRIGISNIHTHTCIYNYIHINNDLNIYAWMHKHIDILYHPHAVLPIQILWQVKFTGDTSSLMDRPVAQLVAASVGRTVPR